MTKVLIASGGSGGHIFPAIALGRSLKSQHKDIELLYVGSDKALDKRIFEKEGVRFDTLSTNKLPYKFSPQMVVVFFKLLVDISKSFSIMLSYKPDVVVGFGGYISFPVMFAAGLLRIPRIVHEQNVVAGRANKLLFKFADKIAISFEDTKKTMGEDAGKAVLTGNPIRAEIFRDDRLYGTRRFGLSADKFTILVIGGSQGATFLNKTFVDALSVMESETRLSIQVIHITGVKDYEWALGAYSQLGIDHRVHSFIDRIEEAYSAADLVITRSGASALFELALLRKPMILVPYPFAMSHQLDNALVFGRKDAAIIIEEKALNAKIFSDTMTGLLKDRNKVKRLGEAAFGLAMPEAANNLAREVIGLAKK